MNVQANPTKKINKVKITHGLQSISNLR